MKIPLAHTGQFSKLFLDYINGEPSLHSFYRLPPQITSFQQAIRTKSNFSHREILAERIEKQYQDAGLEVDTKIFLQPNTFTLTTGHQLNIFTGPLYFVYKILTTIKLAQELNMSYPDYNFVPVYWMATEDHDFEEINHIHLFGKKVEWQPPTIGGAVGRLTTEGFEAIWEQMPELKQVFGTFYDGKNSLAQATRQMVHHFFAHYGLYVIDGDDGELKKIFVPYMEKEIAESYGFEQVMDSSQQLKALGYSTQISPREINLFYLGQFSRDRIVKDADTFRAADRVWTFSELIEHLHNQPQNFSPNVVLRPLYQECVLPNLAYIGGPAEVGYWMQLKGVFDAVQIDFPIVLPRNFLMLIPKNLGQKLQKLGFNSQDIFKDEARLKEAYLENNSSQKVDFEVEKSQIAEIFLAVKAKTKAIDPTLESAAAAEEQKLYKALENLEKKLQKSIENKHAQALGQIANLKTKFFPKGTPQERHDNFLNFWLNDKQVIDLIHKQMTPFNFSYLVVEL